MERYAEDLTLNVHVCTQADLHKEFRKVKMYIAPFSHPLLLAPQH